MQIHELNHFDGNLDGGVFFAVDNGADTGKISASELFTEVSQEIADLDNRIDNIVGGGDAPSQAEILDARLGANGAHYDALGTAIRAQINNLEDELIDAVGEIYNEYTGLTWNANGYINGNGAVVANNNQHYTDFFPLKHSDGTTPSAIIVNKPTTGEWVNLSLCNANDQQLSFTMVKDVFTEEIPIPTNAVKCRFSAHNSVYQNVTVKSKKEMLVEKVASIEDIVDDMADVITFTWNENGYVNGNGTITANTNNHYSDITPIDINGVIPTKITIKKPTINDWVNYCFYDASDNFVYFSYVQNVLKEEISVPVNAAKIRISASNSTFDEVVVISNIVEQLIKRVGSLASGKVVLSMGGNDVSFGSSLQGHSMVLTAEKSNTRADANPIFNFSAYNMDGALFKAAADDISPIQIHQPNMSTTYIGGGHGFSNGLKLTTTNEKTEADIGSIWEDANGTQFVIYNVGSGYVKVVNATVKTITSPLTHVSGATDTATIVFSASEMDFLLPATNGHSLKFFDAYGTELSEDGIYYSNYFDVVESYNIIDPVAAIDYIKSHVGLCTNESIANSTIQNLCKVNLVYRITEGCACTVYQSVDSVENIVYLYAGLIQASKIGNYAYVPDAFGNAIQVLNGSQLDVGSNVWDDASKVPYRYYQFNDSNYSKGFFIGYYPNAGTAKNSERLAKCNKAGIFYTSGKMYPYLINNQTINSGGVVEAICFRSPLIKRNDGSLAVTFNYVGEDVIVCIDYQSAYSGFIDLIDDCAGKRIEVIDKTDSCIFTREIASSTKLPVNFSGKGYIVLRFYN